MEEYLKKVEKIEEVKKGSITEKILAGRNYVTVRVDGDIKNIALKHNLNIQGTFSIGVLLLTDEMPETLKKLCDSFEMNDKERELAKKYFITKYVERVKKGKQCHFKSLVSYAVYKALKESGKEVSLNKIWLMGGATPQTVKAFLEEEGEKIEGD